MGGGPVDCQGSKATVALQRLSMFFGTQIRTCVAKNIPQIVEIPLETIVIY